MTRDSTADGTADGPTDVNRVRVWTWRRLVAVTAARSLLVGLIGLAAWAALPAVIGWHPTTVSSGSMMPRLHVGDIAVSRPLRGQAPPLQSVLLYDDPDHAGRLRMHRFIRLEDDGLMVTRGDANPAEDSTPIGLGAVLGIGTLRVPWVGLPIVWLRDGRWIFLALAAAALALTLSVASSGRDSVFDDDERHGDDPDDAEGAAGVDEEGVSGAPASESSGTDRSSAVDGAALEEVTRDRRSWLPVRRGAAVLGAGLLAAVVSAPVLPRPAFARFGDTTTTASALGATPYFSCANALTALDADLWYRMDETSSSATSATDSSGNRRTGTYSQTGKTTTTSRACGRDTGRAMTFNGSSGYLTSPRSSGGMPSTFTLAIWFRTTTRSGGKLIGFGNAQTGASSSYDRHLYMANNGWIYFGVYPGVVRTVSTSTAYNDGDWHLAVASLSSAGMRLYLDGARADSDPSTTSAEPGTAAYLRIGYDNLDGWDATPTSRYFAGTLDDAAYLPTALSPAQVEALYEAGTS